MWLRNFPTLPGYCLILTSNSKFVVGWGVYKYSSHLLVILTTITLPSLWSLTLALPSLWLLTLALVRVISVSLTSLSRLEEVLFNRRSVFLSLSCWTKWLTNWDWLKWAARKKVQLLKLLRIIWASIQYSKLQEYISVSRHTLQTDSTGTDLLVSIVQLSIVQVLI